MTAESPQPDPVEEQIRQLQSKDDAVRLAALRSIAECENKDRRVFEIIWTMSEQDPNAAIRSAARDVYLNAERPVAPSAPGSDSKLDNEKKQEWGQNVDFWIGLVGWFLVNGLAWALLISGSRATSPYGNFWTILGGNIFLLPGNLIVLLILAIFRRRVALGVLTAFAVNLVLGLLLQAQMNAVCGIPFFIK